MNIESYYMWLNRISGLGTIRQEILLEIFHTPKEIFNAPKECLKGIQGISPQLINNILENQDIQLIRNYENELNTKNIRYISKYNKEFPSLLLETEDTPMGIYIMGELPPESMERISIIGSRKCTHYGLNVAQALSKGLAEHNIVVISGMARGIDSVAHRGALEGKGQTIAVLGCGIDVCYPPENLHLRDEIIKNGCVISEYPPSVTPLPAYFPARNRIISGLSKATLVVEAAKKSGTLITTDRAMTQGRDVLAVPGNITSKLSQGTNEMIRDGALVITCLEDILHYFNIDIKNKLAQKKAPQTLSNDEKLIYDSMEDQSVSINDIIRKCNIQPQIASYTLTMLEMKGFIVRLNDGGYVRFQSEI